MVYHCMRKLLFGQIPYYINCQDYSDCCAKIFSFPYFQLCVMNIFSKIKSRTNSRLLNYE